MISCIYYVRDIGKVRSVIALAYAATDEGCYSLYVPIKPIPSDLLQNIQELRNAAERAGPKF